MSLNTYAGLLKRGNDANKPDPTYWLIGFLYHAIDTGNLYYYQDSTTRVLIQGAEKTEILKNKTINFAENNVSGVIKDPFTSFKREGFIVPGVSAASSLNGAIKGLPSVGTYSLVRDIAEGYVSRFTVTGGFDIGYISNATVNVVTRRAYNPRLKIRCRADPAWLSTENIQISLSSYNSASNSLFNVDPNYAGAMIGFTTGFANFIARVSTGDGTNYNHYQSTTPKNTDYNTYEIVMSATDIKFYLNDVLFNTQTTNLPPLTTDLYLHARLQKSSAVDTKYFEIAKLYFKDDITP